MYRADENDYDEPSLMMHRMADDRSNFKLQSGAFRENSIQEGSIQENTSLPVERAAK